jgi:hypothetical protein
MGLFTTIGNIFSKKPEGYTEVTISPSTTITTKGGTKITGTPVNNNQEVEFTKTSPTGTTTTTRVRRSTNDSGGSSTYVEVPAEMQSTASPANNNTAVSTPIQTVAISKGNTLKPVESATTERYKRPLGEAVGESVQNVFNFGTIGTKGLGAYTSDIFIKPYEYVYTPKWNKKIGYNINERNYYDPTLSDTTNMTWSQYENMQTSNDFLLAGILRKGEPREVLNQRIAETTISKLEPKYNALMGAAAEEGRALYQERINTGELDLDTAKRRYNIYLDLKAKDINQQYNQEITTDINSRINRVNRYGSGGILTKNLIGGYEYLKTNMNTPPAETYFKTGIKVAEIGGLTAATAFGGSGLTLAAATYLGAGFEKQALEYTAQYTGMTTGQKLTGAASLALSGSAAAFTFNLGMSRYYSEWRNIRYMDLADKPARLTGKETTINNEFITYEAATLKKTPYGLSRTQFIQDVYYTGENRGGVFTKSTTFTRIIDPETNKFIDTFSKSTFTGTANIQNIGEVFRARTTGILNMKGQGLYKTGSLGLSRDMGDYYSVIGGIERKVKYSGEIFKLNGEDTSYIITPSGSRSSQEFYKSFYSGTTAINERIQKRAIVNIGSSKTKASANTLISQGAVLFNAPSDQFNRELQQSKNKPLFITSQVLDLYPLEKQAPKFAGGQSNDFVNLSARASGSAVMLSPAQPGAFKSEQKQSPVLKFKFENPNTLTPDITNDKGKINFDVPPMIPLITINRLGGLDLTSNIVKGGSKKTGYTPSFSALFFNIRGKAPKGVETGINFRPITKKFRFFKVRRFF